MAVRYASSGKPTHSRQPRNYAKTGYYVYGNAVRQPEYTPTPRRVADPDAVARKRRTKRLIKNSRRYDFKYISVLTICAVFVFVMCLYYVHLQSQVTSASKNIVLKQEELTTLKEDNAARYNSIIDSVNLDEVRKKATKEYGMVCAKSKQIVGYKGSSADYVEQYENIPKSGVLASDAKQ